MYIREVWGNERTFTVVSGVTGALSHTRLLRSQRLSKAEKREGNGGSSGSFNTQFECSNLRRDQI